MPIIFIILSFFLFSFKNYEVSPQVEVSEFSSCLEQLKDNAQELPKIVQEMNIVSSSIEITNLKLILKIEFYKSFLNFFPTYKNPESFPTENINLLKDKLKNANYTPLSLQFLSDLIKDFENASLVQKSYIIPWIIRGNKEDAIHMHSTMSRVCLGYLQHLLQTITIIYKNGQNDRANSLSLGASPLILQGEIIESKSKAIDAIDQKLEENIPSS